MPFKGTIHKVKVLLREYKSVTADDTRALSYFPSCAQHVRSQEWQKSFKMLSEVTGTTFPQGTTQTLLYLDAGTDNAI